MYFRHPSADTWAYEVELAEQTGEPIGAGTLTFNDNGSLRRTDVRTKLRYALPEGRSTLEIALDFGVGTDRGGAGVDGSTAFPSAPAVVNLSVRGTGPRLGASCSEPVALDDVPTLPRGGPPIVATRSVRGTDGINLPSFAPLRTDAWDPQLPDDTSSASFPVWVSDADGRSWRLTLYARHVATLDWEYAYVVDGELGRFVSDLAVLQFTVNGALQRFSPFAPFRLPLSDGTPGPTIEIQDGTSIEQGGTGLDWIVSFAGPRQGTLQASSRQFEAR
jgi:hypothetical protein